MKEGCKYKSVHMKFRGVALAPPTYGNCNKEVDSGEEVVQGVLRSQGKVIIDKANDKGHVCKVKHNPMVSEAYHVCNIGRGTHVTLDVNKTRRPKGGRALCITGHQNEFSSRMGMKLMHNEHRLPCMRGRIHSYKEKASMDHLDLLQED